MHRVLYSLLLCFLLRSAADGQTMCPATPAYSICDITFDVPETIPADTELNAEFRGPSHRTFLFRAFRSGPQKLTIRFSPFEAGAWDIRLSSTLSEFHDKQLQMTATPSDSLGWIVSANVHHFRYTGGASEAILTPAHLWIGDTLPPGLDAASFESWSLARAHAGVNHVRVRVPNSMDEAAFTELDTRAAFLNKQNIIVDLVLTPPTRADRQTREAFFKYVIARCAARNATWVILDEFEKYDHAHELVREIAGYLDQDPFHHPRTVGASLTSGVFSDEKWLEFRQYGSPDFAVSAVENQIYLKPAVSTVEATSADEFRHRLWNAVMSGTYPEAAATDPAMLTYLGICQKVLAETRHWELEPFFDAGDARGVSLPEADYLIYIQKPGPVTVRLDGKHKWNAAWINPLTGEHIDLKDFRAELFNDVPPDNSHDWLLYIGREGHKEDLKSYHFESRRIVLQDLEVSAGKVPFEITQPSGDAVSATEAVTYATKLKRETKAAQRMLYLWTGEVTADDEGYRVLGTGASGDFKIPANTVRHFPATLHVRVYGLNGFGKLYSLDQNFAMNQ